MFCRESSCAESRATEESSAQIVDVSAQPVLPQHEDGSQSIASHFVGLRETVKILSEGAAAMEEKFRILNERISVLEQKEAVLEEKEAALERKEEVLEEEEKQLETELDNKIKQVEAALEDATMDAEGPKSFVDMLDDHANRASVKARAEMGVTVDFLELEAMEVYRFDESTWDIAIFIGTKSLGPGGSVLTSVLLAMNVMMQVIFVGIVWYNFAEAQINEDTIEDAKRWRENYAHDFQYMDAQTGFSLVSRVCNNDKSLQIAAAQEELYEFLGDYLKPNAEGLESIFVGKMLCMVALVCWFLMVSKEVHKALDLFRGMLYLPRGIDKLEPIERPGLPTTFKVASISQLRMIFSSFIVGYRLVVSGLLAYCGTYFLVYTIEITELVLNAVALEIILNIDDLLFDAVTTANARHLVVKLEPMRMPRWPHRKGIDLKAVGMAIIIPSCVLLVYQVMISPMVDDLSEVAEALCGGTQNFVFSTDALRMVLFATTPSCGEKVCELPSNVTNSVRYKASAEAVRQGQTNPEFAIWVGDYHRLQFRKGLTFELSADEMAAGACADSLKGQYLHYMRQLVGDQSINNCSDVQHLCSSASFVPEWGPDGGKGLYARLLCPETCECNNPGGSNGLISGCPTTCVSAGNPVYSRYLNWTDTTCPQRSVNDTIHASDWNAWIGQFRQYASFKGNTEVRAYADYMAANGCNLIRVNSGTAAPFCRWTMSADPAYKYNFKGVSYHCPQDCKCFFLLTPKSCPSCYHRRRRS